MELKGNIKDFPLPDIIQLVGLGKKTGMLSIAFQNQKASLYFKDGRIVHASMLNSEGKDAIIKMFHLEEGKFHFFADVKSETETINLDPMNVLMDAARHFDERRKDAGYFEREGVKDGARKKYENNIVALKEAMIKVVVDLYGTKAKKIEKLISNCGNSEIELINACDKAEKYIYVFLDPENSKAVADKMRQLIEETH